LHIDEEEVEVMNLFTEKLLERMVGSNSKLIRKKSWDLAEHQKGWTWDSVVHTVTVQWNRNSTSLWLYFFIFY